MNSSEHPNTFIISHVTVVVNNKLILKKVIKFGLYINFFIYYGLNFRKLLLTGQPPLSGHLAYSQG